MKISQLLNSGKPTISFEVFPPKVSSSYESVEKAVNKIAQLKPDFMSVTYGAGGGTSKYTLSIAKNILDNYNVTPIAHLSCVSSSKEDIEHQLDELEQNGIENILALRGDIPANAPDRSEWSYQYASELIADIKKSHDFCIGGACYPEGHPESATQVQDIENLKKKVDAGCEFLTTQMFFDNDIMYNFLYKVREKGITVPIIPGIMPITNPSQVKKTASLSGTHLPRRFIAIVDRFGDNKEAMTQAGVAYATEQIIDLLANGINYIHVYTMNKPEVAAQIMSNLSSILR